MARTRLKRPLSLRPSEGKASIRQHHELAAAHPEVILRQVRTLTEASPCVFIIDLSSEDAPDWSETGCDWARDMADHLEKSRSAMALILPNPRHHAAIRCLEVHMAGGCILTVTDRGDAEEWARIMTLNGHA